MTPPVHGDDVLPSHVVHYVAAAAVNKMTSNHDTTANHLNMLTDTYEEQSTHYIMPLQQAIS